MEEIVSVSPQPDSAGEPESPRNLGNCEVRVSVTASVTLGSLIRCTNVISLHSPQDPLQLLYV